MTDELRSLADALEHPTSRAERRSTEVPSDVGVLSEVPSSVPVGTEAASRVISGAPVTAADTTFTAPESSFPNGNPPEATAIMPASSASTAPPPSHLTSETQRSRARAARETVLAPSQLVVLEALVRYVDAKVSPCTCQQSCEMSAILRCEYHRIMLTVRQQLVIATHLPLDAPTRSPMQMRMRHSLRHSYTALRMTGHLARTHAHHYA